MITYLLHKRNILKNYKQGLLSIDEAAALLEEREVVLTFATLLLTTISFITYNYYIG